MVDPSKCEAAADLLEERGFPPEIYNILRHYCEPYVLTYPRHVFRTERQMKEQVAEIAALLGDDRRIIALPEGMTLQRLDGVPPIEVEVAEVESFVPPDPTGDI